MIGRFSDVGQYRKLFDTGDLVRVFVGGFLALAGYLVQLWGGGLFGTLLILASVGINGFPIVKEAVAGLMEKKVNVDELVSIAIIASLFSGEFLSAAVVSFIMVLGALIEEATGESARKAIHDLIEVSPKRAIRVVDGREEEIAVADVKKGDLLLVKAGELIPVDAEVTEGGAAVDESSITGEPIPVDKVAGDTVYAGTLCENGLLTVRAERVGKETTLGRVISLVTEAEGHHPESVSLIDRYAQWFTPFILFCAAATLVLTGELSRAVTVLIVGCPCALILAAPTAIVATISRAAREGILIKGGKFIEQVCTAKAVLFDKTGTLTEGSPRVARVVAGEGTTESDILAMAAAVESGSTHPLARAVVEAAGERGIAFERAGDLFVEGGTGIRGTVDGRSVEVGKAPLSGVIVDLPRELTDSLAVIRENGETPLIVYEDGRAKGIISVTDHIRSTAAESVKGLKKLEIDTIGILSGDHGKAVELVGSAVGVTESWSDLKPHHKLEKIDEIRKKGFEVIFVGDGINDAPALAASSVGIAMGARGTEVALETADIALMHDDLSKLPFLFRLSKRMVTIIKWNIVFGMSFNLIAVLAGGSGMISPILGAVVHNVGSVIVVLSSASIAFVFERNRVA